MKTTILFCLLFFSFQSFAGNCINGAKAAILQAVSKSLKVPANNLMVRYIGGESQDGDTNSRGHYVSPSQEIFDVFKGPSSSKNTASGMYVIDVTEITDQRTEKTINCELGEIQSVPRNEWGSIYNIYL